MNFKSIFENSKPLDYFIFIFLIIFSLFGILITRQIKTDNSNVYIEVDGKLIYILPINKDKKIFVKGALGLTEIEIKNKMVRIVNSPCKNKNCVKQGWINKGTIICLPNRVTVRVGNDNKHKIDGFTG